MALACVRRRWSLHSLALDQGLASNSGKPTPQRSLDENRVYSVLLKDPASQPQVGASADALAERVLNITRKASVALGLLAAQREVY